MSSNIASANLAALSDSIKLTFHLIHRLSKLTFQPGSVPLEEHGDVGLELVQDIRDSLKQNEDDLESVRQEVDDLIGLSTTSSTSRRRDSIKERDRARLAAQVARLEEDLKHARSQFRKAQLTSKRASEAAKQKEREILFSTLQQPLESGSGTSTSDLFAARKHHQPKQLTQDEVLVNASSDVTSALRRTHDLLTSELSRSRFAQETLDQSTAALSDLGERYSDLDSLLTSSKSLLGTLVRSQKSDTWYLETAFYILVATLSWLVFRRLIYGPAWWFIWLPLKFLVFKPFYFIFAAFGIKTSAQNSITSTATTIPRPPLRIQPSARGGIPRYNMGDDQHRPPAIPAGGGGRGAKRGNDGQYEETMSSKIGEMVEASRQQAQGAAETHKDEPGVVRRGDGTILQERGKVPPNPKKKQWEEDVESAKHEHRKRDEL